MDGQIIGLAISGYRAFSEEYQYLSPLDRLNIFIGENNSGKSTILNFLNEQKPFSATNSWSFGDSHISNATLRPKIKYALKFSEFIQPIREYLHDTERGMQCLTNIEELVSEEGLVWLDVDIASSAVGDLEFSCVERLQADVFSSLGRHEWHKIQLRILKSQGGDRNRAQPSVTKE